MTTPYNLWQIAKDFLESATFLAEHVKWQDPSTKLGVLPNLPAYYLICHAAELALKAYIRCFDDDEALRKISHRLMAAYRRAEILGLPDLVTLDSRFVSVLALADESYKTKNLEYSDVGFVNLYLPDVLIKGVSAILEATEDPCFEATKAQREKGGESSCRG